MIKIELDESEARELLDAARAWCRLWINNAFEKIHNNNYDDEYKTALFHMYKICDIGNKIEDSLNKE